MNSEAVTYSEFTNALSNPVLLGLVNVSPLSGSIIIELADNLGYAIVDRMLGGLGTPLDKPRDFSEIELLILERIYNVCVSLCRSLGRVSVRFHRGLNGLRQTHSLRRLFRRPR